LGKKIVCDKFWRSEDQKGVQKGGISFASIGVQGRGGINCELPKMGGGGGREDGHRPGERARENFKI